MSTRALFACTQRAVLLCAALVATASPALAQESSAPNIQPPVLVTFVPAIRPSGDRETAVELELLVGVDGHVEDARVVESGGTDFDAAALDAARQFVFTPASKDGVSMRARIRYRYVFEAVVPSPPVSEPPPAPANDPPPPAEPEDAPLAEFGATAEVAAPAIEITSRKIDVAEQTRLAGTRGDVLRTIELLPGVARPPGTTGMLLVRGAAPWDSEVSFAGAPALRLYHFGGITSFINGNLVDGIELYPGNFSVRYGRRIGAIIRTDLRDPKTDRVRSIVDVNLIDASVLAEGPLAKNVSFAVAARRSYVDAWLTSLTTDEVDLVAAPVYWDYQALLVAKPTPRDRVRLLGYGLGDTFAIVNDPSETDPEVRGKLANRNTAHRLLADWRRRWSGELELDSIITAGPLSQSASLGPNIFFDVSGYDAYARSELRWTAPHLRLTSGVDIAFVSAGAVYKGPPIGQAEGDPHQTDPLASQPTQIVDRHLEWFRPAGYAELALRPVGAAEVTFGARADYASDIRTWMFDPRATAKYRIGATTLKGGIGKFSQPPDYEWSFLDTMHTLRSLYAVHYSTGVEHELGPRASIGVEGFYKDLHRLIATGSDRTMLTNRGTGRIYGVELAGRLNPGGVLSGLFSYTLSRSERDDQRGEGWRLFDFDQTHILSAAANLNLGRWMVGTAFRFTSGNPETPVVGSIYDADHDTYVPVYGATNSTRSTPFHRLDIRVERDFQWLGATWAGYLDIQNIYNRRNREGTRYSYDFAERADVSGLPVLPSLGLSARF